MNGRKELSIQLKVFIFMLAFVLTVPAVADTHYVSPGQSIQAAIDDANDGDEIEVAVGTYYEAINFNGKAVRLRNSDPNDPNIVAATIIDGTGHYHVVRCVSGEDANTILEGFTITGGDANGPPGDDRCGGGMFNQQSSPTVMNCIFTGNAAFDGAGMYNYYLSSPTVSNCNFSGNWSESGGGGGMYNFFHSKPTVSNCVFSGNTAGGGYGGGMHNRYYSDTKVTNCTFSGNSAGRGGGMFNREYSSSTVTQCTFSGNTADQDGGGMYNSDSSPTVTNCTFNSNTAAFDGGGMYNFQSNPVVTNCILWGDMPDEIYNISSIPSITYSDIQGGYGGTGNIYADPLFVNAAADNLRLNPDSPCIDAGSNSAPNLPPMDLAGNPRVVDGDSDGIATIDMGVFEFQPRIHNTTQDTWHATLQRSIDYANDGDEIVVPPDTYYETIDFKGRAITLRSSDPNDPNIVADTIIDGTGYYHVVQCISGEDADTILEGFTITGGDANGPLDEDKCGGGMYNRGSPTVTNCTFASNSADTDGGGMYNYQSYPRVTDCTFSGNSAGTDGGGMYNYQSYPRVTDCTFSGNSATYGGGMYNYDKSPTVTNCTFSGNSATHGGGMYNYDTFKTIVTNCTFSGNSGCGMCNIMVGACIFWVTNCTFSGNTYGGGMYSDGSEDSSLAVTNCTFSNNDGSGMFNSHINLWVTNCTFTDNSLRGMMNWESGRTLVTNCTFTGNTTNSGGGGMLNFSSNDLTVVTNCTFIGNSATWGGGMYNYQSSVTVTNCTFSHNSGGGMRNDGSSTIVTNSTFTGNTFTGYGAAIHNVGESSSTMANCILWANEPNEIFNDASSSITVTYSDLDGGWGDPNDPNNTNIDLDPCFVDAGNPDPNLWNLRLKPDSPCIDAGDNNAPGLPATDLASNRRVFDGDGNSSAIVDMGAYEFGSLNLLAHWKLDESSGGTAYDSIGDNHGTLEPADAPPLWQPAGGRLGGALEFDGFDDFVSIPNESRFDITYQLTVSAWIQVAAFDKDWQAIATKYSWWIRRYSLHNALEFHCANLYNQGGTEPGSVYVQGSVDVNDGQWHHVAGVYDGTQIYLYVDGVLDNSDLASGTISTNDYPVIIGGEDETPTHCWNGLIDDVRIYTCGLSPSEVYQLYSNICYVDADATGNNDGSSWTDAFNYLQDALAQAPSGSEIRVAEGTYKPDANSSNPSGSGDRTATFELINGVILKGGYAGFGEPNPNARDCDLYETTLSGDINTPGDANDNCYHVVTSSGCDPNTVLEGFTITGGNANGTFPDDHGGGMYNSGSSPTVSNCIFTDNASQAGGGMCNEGSNPMVTDCTFSHNTAGNGAGGGMYNNQSSPIVENCSFIANTAGYSGGMFNGNSSPTVTNCTFSDNSANWGGGMYNYQSSPKMINCTFSGNSATNAGGGILNQFDSSPIVTNCIFWGDMPIEIADWDTSTTTVTYSDVQGSYTGTGNIDADPCFVDSAAGNLRLRPGSPCVEVGDNSEPNLPLTDLDGHPRIIDGDCDDVDVVDMGAYEFALAYLGDFDSDCSVDFEDYAALSRVWLTEPADPEWDPVYDVSDPPDDYIDWRDVAILCDNWLAQIP